MQSIEISISLHQHLHPQCVATFQVFKLNFVDLSDICHLSVSPHFELSDQFLWIDEGPVTKIWVVVLHRQVLRCSLWAPESSFLSKLIQKMTFNQKKTNFFIHESPKAFSSDTVKFWVMISFQETNKFEILNYRLFIRKKLDSTVSEFNALIRMK